MSEEEYHRVPEREQMRTGILITKSATCAQTLDEVPTLEVVEVTERRTESHAVFVRHRAEPAPRNRADVMTRPIPQCPPRHSRSTIPKAILSSFTITKK